MKRCLIIFAKEPQSGSVKTRLSSCLDDEKRIELYKAFIKDTILIAKSVKYIKRILAYDAYGGKPYYLKTIAEGFFRVEQKGKDLGERLAAAFGISKKLGAKKTVVIGSDSPTLPKDFIVRAFEALDENDIVLGPTQDGGYYLIGAKDCPLGLFTDIHWSTEKVLNQTLKNAKVLHLKVKLLKKWYDIDNPKDFYSFKRKMKIMDPRMAPNTRKVLEILS